ncbi:hypothetical protein ASA1KI_13210 [Opitutales bacterium ASA1]|uniref:tetratricopeptide repeat protein n=1 Tax=Congregicoccus parvus TaxID=3081749 RepID=UPI002B319497|nr:hypothetical protein ASA1KI_13210 [Opitutales bacterium ASA1]
MARARPRPDEKPASDPFHRSTWFAVATIVVAALVGWHGSFTVPFVFDDELAIVGNASIRSLSTALQPPPEIVGAPVSGRPLVNVSLALNHAMSGLEPWSYHGFNLLVHIGAGLLLFAVTRRTLRAPVVAPRTAAAAGPIALVTALLWTVHPLQTQAVTYVSQRAESMVGFFLLLTLWCHLRATASASPRGWHACAFVACLCGMATKEVMVVAPVLVALHDRTFVSGSWKATWTARRGPLLALGATWTLLFALLASEGGRRGVSAGFGLGVSPWHYLLTQCEAIVLYARLSVWPHPLVLDYGTAVVRTVGAVWWQGLVVLGLLAGTAWALVRRPTVGFVGAWFFLILAPTSSIVPVVGQTIAEHRMYLPLAAMLVGAVCAVQARWARAGVFAAALLAVPLVALTIARNRDYSTAVGIFEDTLAKRPDNARAMVLLADYLRREGRTAEARRWLERSAELEPLVAPTWNNLGFTLLASGDTTAAIAAFERALALAPHDAHTLANLGGALASSGRIDEGITLLERAVRSDPAAAGPRINLATLLARERRFEAAAEHYAMAIASAPTDVEARLGFSDVLQALGRASASTEQLRHAVRLRPEDASLRNSLGIALARTGLLREALDEFREAVRLDPTNDFARQNAERAQRRLDGG